MSVATEQQFVTRMEDEGGGTGERQTREGSPTGIDPPIRRNEVREALEEILGTIPSLRRLLDARGERGEGATDTSSEEPTRPATTTSTTTAPLAPPALGT